MPSSLWIPCTDLLPDSDTTVLVHDPNADEPVWFGWHDGETWRQSDAQRITPTHWQHLPDPPA